MPMQAHPIEGDALTYFLVEPEDYVPEASYPLVVLLHGFGASMYDLVNLCPAIDPGGYMYACPNAPFAIDLGGAVGYSWSRGMPGAPSTGEDGPRAEDLLEAFFQELMAKTGVQPGRILLGGFSQGGGLTLRFGLPRPDLFAGLAVLSGAFRNSDDLVAGLPPSREQPLFVAHGLQDPMVAIDRGRETKAWLESQGYRPEYHEYEIGHEISEEEIWELARWMRSVLPPLTD